MKNERASYPKPLGEAGGRLMRAIVAHWRKNQQEATPLPLIDSHILLAVSGGPDSIALAWALGRYGRRVVPREGLTLGYFDHRLRGAKASADEWGAVQEIAAKLGVPAQRAEADDRPAGLSLEEWARAVRRRALEKMATEIESQLRYPKGRKRRVWIATAHHADDVAETLIWRMCSGAKAEQHRVGILPVRGRWLRPFLSVRRALLREFLAEEGIAFVIDATNLEGSGMRARMRRELMPSLENLFPRAVDHLTASAMRAWSELPVGKRGLLPPI